MKLFLPKFSWDVCLFTLVKPKIMGGCGFHFAMTLTVYFSLNNVYFYYTFTYSTAQRRCPLTQRSELARALIVNIY